MHQYRYVILGGGMVAGYAAKTLVEQGLGRGELAIVSADSEPPYERPPLSKGYLAGKEEEASVFINDGESGSAATFYQAHGITLLLNAPVTAVDLQAKELRPRDGDPVGFEKLLIATGSMIRRLDVPGADEAGVLYLRSLDDARLLRSAIGQARRVVVFGGGFIGMEVASVIAGRGIETALVFPEKRVWERFFTPEMSTFFERYYREHGVTIVAEELVERFERDGGKGIAITKSGRRLPADLFVAGIGVAPATDMLHGAGLSLDNGVVVNEYLETNVPGVYAAGDVANYYDVIFEKQRRVEHWDNAVEQGKHAARILRGERMPFVHIPYYFSDEFDLSYEFWGDTAGADQVVYRGDVTDVNGKSFSVWWLAGSHLAAAFTMNRPDEEREAAPRWISDRSTLSADQLKNAPKLMEAARR